MNDWMEALEASGWVVAFSKSVFWFGLVTVVHYFTLFFMTGAVVALNLRVLGLVATDTKASDFADEIFPWIWISMILAVISGFGLALVQAGDYYRDPVTRTKIVICFLGFLCTWYIRRNVPNWESEKSVSMPAAAKVASLVCLFLWFAAVLAGADIAAISGLG